MIGRENNRINNRNNGPSPENNRGGCVREQIKLEVLKRWVTTVIFIQIKLMHLYTYTRTRFEAETQGKLLLHYPPWGPFLERPGNLIYGLDIIF